jgi:hypothetical protein
MCRLAVDKSSKPYVSRNVAPFQLGAPSVAPTNGPSPVWMSSLGCKPRKQNNVVLQYHQSAGALVLSVHRRVEMLVPRRKQPFETIIAVA